MRRPMLAMLLATWACAVPSAFPCASDVECAKEGQQGVCVGPGYCAFDDPNCDSGLRFGEHAQNDLAGECVEPMPDATGTTSVASETVDPPTSIGHDSSESVTSSSGMVSASSTGPGCPASWWDCAWSHRRPIEVVHEGEPVDEFPAFVLLDDSRIDYAAARADGTDVRFVQGQQALPHEIVTWQPDGISELWVRLPQVLTGDELYVYYGNEAAADTSNAAQVWTSGYLVVMHMLDTTDALGTLSLNVFDVEAAPGLLGNGIAFDQSGYLQDQGDRTPLFPPAATITTVFNAWGWGQAGYGRIVDTSNINSTDNGFAVGLAGPTSGHEALRFARGFDGNRGSWYSAQQSITLDAWTVCAVSYDHLDTEGPSIWIGGQPSAVMTDTVPTGDPVDVPMPLTIGALGDGSLRYFGGVIDELHIATTLRSDAWAAAENASFTDQMFSFGPEETRR